MKNKELINELEKTLIALQYSIEVLEITTKVFMKEINKYKNE